MDPLTIWIMCVATLWVVRILAEELWAAIRGAPSPGIARRRARAELARESGTPTVGQALSARLVARIKNPPERRWGAALRVLVDELLVDALDEARVRHQYNHAERLRRRAREHARRQGGDGPRYTAWQARTGDDEKPPPPDPPADAAVMETRPCAGCGVQLVVPPEELCVACELAAMAPALATPGTDIDPPPDQTSENPSDTKESTTVTSATHTISGDVRDPRTALAFATTCRLFNDGIVRELEILANNMRQEGLGAGPLGEIRVLADAARSYSASNQKSVREYAEHVVVQQEIHYDDDLRETVRRTYLDTHGSDAVAVGGGSAGRTTHTINAADCRTPAAAARFMDSVAAAYTALKAQIDLTKGNHIQQGVTGEPVAFLDAQLQFATVLDQKAGAAAATFRRHVRKMQDTVGAKKALQGTQKGRYLDPTKA